jgi:hypothetical protein
VIVGLIAGFAQLLAHDRPTQRLTGDNPQAGPQADADALAPVSR